MKRKIIGSLLLLTALLVTAPAGAATTCLCVGNPYGQTCGSGGIGGGFLRVITPVESKLIQYFMLTMALRAQLDSTGKAYDSTTGWFCWNGTLQ
jgi:hypothetical protein